MKKILVTVAAVIFTVTMTVYFSAANAADTTGTTNSKTYQKNGERPEPPEFNGKDGQNGERPEPPEFNGKDGQNGERPEPPEFNGKDEK